LSDQNKNIVNEPCLSQIDAALINDYFTAMTIKPIIYLPDPVLRQQSLAVERVDSEMSSFIDDMLETMYDAPGIGLAAIQVGVPRRLLVIDIAGKDEEPDPQVFINPEVVATGDGVSVYEEGCLSIPDYYADVERPETITVKYLDRAGKEQTVEADGCSPPACSTRSIT
jgi:peptide deformylase